MANGGYGRGPDSDLDGNEALAELRARARERFDDPNKAQLIEEGRPRVEATLERGLKPAIPQPKPATEVVLAGFERCSKVEEADCVVFSQSEVNPAALKKACAEFGTSVAALDCRLEIQGGDLVLSRQVQPVPEYGTPGFYDAHERKRRSDESFAALVGRMEAWGSEMVMRSGRSRIESVSYWRAIEQKAETRAVETPKEKSDGRAVEHLAEKIPGLTGCKDGDSEATHLIIDLADAKIKAGALPAELGKLPEGIRLITDGKNKVAALIGPYSLFLWLIQQYPLLRQKDVQLSLAKAPTPSGIQTGAKVDKADEEKPDLLKAWLGRNAATEARQAAVREAEQRAVREVREHEAARQRAREELKREAARVRAAAEALVQTNRAGLAQRSREVAERLEREERERKPKERAVPWTAEQVSHFVLREFFSDGIRSDVLEARTLRDLEDDFQPYTDTLFALIDCGNDDLARQIAQEEYGDGAILIGLFYEGRNNMLVMNHGSFIVISSHNRKGRSGELSLSDDMSTEMNTVARALFCKGEGKSPYNTRVTRVKRRPEATRPARDIRSEAEQKLGIGQPVQYWKKPMTEGKPAPATAVGPEAAESADAVIEGVLRTHFPDLSMGDVTQHSTTFAREESAGGIHYEDALMVLVRCGPIQPTELHLSGMAHSFPEEKTTLRVEPVGNFLVIRLEDRAVSTWAMSMAVRTESRELITKGLKPDEIGLTIVKRKKSNPDKQGPGTSDIEY